MSSVQERLQLKREPFDQWSIREQLCLASAVARSGDQNWMSVSRALKPFADPNRPSDWFHQKNCAAQYGMLLKMVESSKRKKRTSSVDSSVDTPIENVLKKLQVERLAELRKLLADEKSEYQKLQDDMKLLQTGLVTEEQLDVWCKEIDEEEYRKEQDVLAHTKWLKEREQRKQEIERTWRPNKLPIAIGQKRKNSDSVDAESEHFEEIQHQLQQQQQIQHQFQIQQNNQQSQELTKPALSPLLTSLLKSPSQVQNTSILHTAITNRHIPNTSTNPTIASLLNSTTTVPVSPGIQQLVSTAIGQSQETVNVVDEQNMPIGNDILDDAHLTNIKLDDLANSILVQDGPLPEIKKEEVDDIISEIIENAGDIVDDPEQHLQLDGNGDININLELSDFDEEIIQDMGSPPKECNKEEAFDSSKTDVEEKNPIVQTSQRSSPQPVVDPFEFQEDPIVFEPSSKPSGSIVKQDPHYVPHYQQQQQHQSGTSSQSHQNSFESEVPEENSKEQQTETDSEEIIEEQLDYEGSKESKEPSKDPVMIEKTRGSVEIVAVSPTEEEESGKELNKSEIEDIVHSCKSSILEDNQLKHFSVETVDIGENELEVKTETSEEDVEEEQQKAEQLEEESTTTTWTTTTESKESVTTTEEISETSDNSEMKKDFDINVQLQKHSSDVTSSTNEFTEDLYNEMNVDIKMELTSTVKRDYSRSKRKDEKDMDVLLAIKKSQLDDSDFTEEVFSDSTADVEKKDIKSKIKSENERSSSPWTEEEDNTNRTNKRRYSTPATPVDSVPNSPASSNAFYEDDREYKNWKKSVMLVYNRLATNRYASLFLKPITEDQAPEPRQPPVTFEPGTLVLVRNFAKSNFGQTWVGPFPILRREGETVYSIDRNGSERLIHLKDIRMAPPNYRRREAEPSQDEPFEAPDHDPDEGPEVQEQPSAVTETEIQTGPSAEIQEEP